MIDAIIVDDEEKAVAVLRRLIGECCPEVRIVAETTRVSKALELIEEHRPQLLFLDIEMPGMTGFDLLERIKNENFHVIFVTAHDEYAVQAFRFSVADYLLKPVDIDQLQHAISKVKNLIEAFAADEAMNKNQELQEIQTLRIPTTEGTAFVHLKNIVRLEASGSYTHVYMDNGKKYLMSDYLKQIEEYLDQSMFIRVHRSHIINIKKITAVIDKRGLFVQMEDGASIEVSRRIKAGFLNVIHQKK